MLKSQNFRLTFEVNTSKQPENHCIICKAEYMSMQGHPSGKYFKQVPHVWGKKWCMFCRLSAVQNIFFFLEISQFRHVRVHLTPYNVKVTIFVTCLNLFAGTGSQILLPAVSSSLGAIPSQKIALNSNGKNKISGTSSEALNITLYFN